MNIPNFIPQQFNILQLFFIISACIILVIAFDIARRKKFNALHFFVFLGIGGGLVLFTLFPRALDILAPIFGVARGADALVYGGIIFLTYFSLLLLNRSEKSQEDITKIIREFALNSASFLPQAHTNVFIIRAYNEATRIGQVLQELIESKAGAIIVIDDGSSDATRAIVESFEIPCFSHPQNRGGGAALETGLEYVRRYAKTYGWETITTFDADGQHHIADFPAFKQALDTHKEAGIAFGSRFLEGATHNAPWFRRCVLWGSKIFTYGISKIHLSDPHNGFRMMRVSLLDSVKLTLDGMEYASELIDQISQQAIPFVEVPVHITYDEYTLAKGQKNLNALNIALRIIWVKFFR